MEFEWDEQKNERNRAKHGVSFEEATRIFGHPVVAEEDTRRDYGERRFIAYGETEGHILTVVFTWREERLRIISARRANHHERGTYQAVYSR